jgi:hypothetical protein
MRFRNGIIIAMIAFVTFIVTMGVIISSKDSELISEDYYIKEKSFNEDFDAEQRAADNKNPIRISNLTNGIGFVNHSKLDIRMIDLTFVCMNNGKSDFTLKNHPIDKGIHKDKLAKGNYEIQMRYRVKNIPFMQVITWYYK